MGQFPCRQKGHSATEAENASITTESGCSQGKSASHRSLIRAGTGQRGPADRSSKVARCDATAGLVTISRYAEKYGEWPVRGTAMNLGNTRPAVGIYVAGTLEYANSSPRETWAGRAAKASARKSFAGLRAFREYIRVSSGAMGQATVGADGTKEIDCYV